MPLSVGSETFFVRGIAGTRLRSAAVEDPDDFKIPEGSVAVGRRVRLPNGAEPPISVYINGVEQLADEAYEIQGREVVFARPILKEAKLGKLRWLSMLIGLVGSYRKHETVDLSFQCGEATQLSSDVDVIPD